MKKSLESFRRDVRIKPTQEPLTQCRFLQRAIELTINYYFPGEHIITQSVDSGSNGTNSCTMSDFSLNSTSEDLTLDCMKGYVVESLERMIKCILDSEVIIVPFTESEEDPFLLVLGILANYYQHSESTHPILRRRFAKIGLRRVHTEKFGLLLLIVLSEDFLFSARGRRQSSEQQINN